MRVVNKYQTQVNITRSIDCSYYKVLYLVVELYVWFVGPQIVKPLDRSSSSTSKVASSSWSFLKGID